MAREREARWQRAELWDPMPLTAAGLERDVQPLCCPAAYFSLQEITIVSRSPHALYTELPAVHRQFGMQTGDARAVHRASLLFRHHVPG